MILTVDTALERLEDLEREDARRGPGQGGPESHRERSLGRGSGSLRPSLVTVTISWLEDSEAPGPNSDLPGSCPGPRWEARSLRALTRSQCQSRGSRWQWTPGGACQCRVRDKLLVLQKCAGTQNVADALTTSLPAPAFEKHSEYLWGSGVPFSAFWARLEDWSHRSVFKVELHAWHALQTRLAAHLHV